MKAWYLLDKPLNFIELMFYYRVLKKKFERDEKEDGMRERGREREENGGFVLSQKEENKFNMIHILICISQSLKENNEWSTKHFYFRNSFPYCPSYAIWIKSHTLENIWWHMNFRRK